MTVATQPIPMPLSDALVHGVSRAEADLTAAQEAHAARLADHERVNQRLTMLQGELDQIQARRLSGQVEADDAARVELLNLDSAGLTRLADKAAAAVAEAQQAVETAQQALQHSQRQWTQHQAHVAAVALENRLHELERTLTSGIARLAELCRQAEPGTFVAATQIYRVGPELNRFLLHGVTPPVGG